MRWLGRIARPTLCGFLLLSLAAYCSANEQEVDAPKASQATSQNAPVQKHSPPHLSSVAGDELKPARSIDLLPIDFRRLSRLRTQDGARHLTVNFLDEDQLLVTFEGAALTHRLRTCPRTHDDRIVHAVLLDAHSLEVRLRVDWYLHDQRQYLWPLGPGQMLLRRGESLLQLDRDLNEKPLLEAKGLVWVDVTPDGKQIALEVQSNKMETNDSEKGPKPSYEVRFLDTATLSVLKKLSLNHLVPLKATADGYADVDLKGAWTWLVRFGPPSQRRLAVTRVRSTCIPDLEISSESSLLIGRCTPAQDRYVMSSFTTAGQFLWRQQWLGQPISTPVVTRSASGGRFALSTVAVTEKGMASATDDDDDRPEVRVQRIELFNTATGTSALTVQTQPAVTVGGNFALSPEGTTLAVLRDARLELYEVPELGKEEEAKLAAARAGTPGLIPPPSTADPEEDAVLADGDDTPAMQPAVAARDPQTQSAAASGAGSPRASQPAPAALGDANEQSRGSPLSTFRSSAQAVVVDVTVTDSKGHPITGLKPEDFTLTEEGSVQRISYFTEHSVVDTRQTPPPEYKHPANIFSNVSNTSQPDSATMILFDMLNTPVQDQAHEREVLTRYIKNKPKNESFALCVLAGPLRLIRGFTTDENELLLGLLDKRARPSASLISQLDNASLNFIRTAAHNFQNTNDLSQQYSIAAAGVERTLQDQQLSQDDMRVYMTVAAFDQLARYMAGVPGRKKVLWLSAAFPLGRFASPDGQLDAGPFHQERSFVRLVSETVNLLASAHVSVYPVDVRGVTDNTLYNAGATMPFRQNLPDSPLTSPFGTRQIQAGGGGFGGGNAALNLSNTHAAPNNAFVSQNLEDSVRRNSEHTTMDLVAEQTGGKAFYGSNDITDALRATVEQGADYYTLSYTPSNRNYDGRFRKIHVKVAGHNYRVAHRSGYFAEDPHRLPEKSEAVLRSLSAAGMMHGSPESRQIPFEVRVVPVGEPKAVNLAEAGIRASKDVKNAPTTVKLQHYKVDFAISAAPLRFDSGPEGNLHGSFRLMANSFDREGRALLQAASTAVADVQPSSYQKILSEGLRLRQELDVPANAGFLRLGVGDLATSYVGTLELPLPIPAIKDDPLARREKALPPIEPE